LLTVKGQRRLAELETAMHSLLIEATSDISVHRRHPLPRRGAFAEARPEAMIPLDTLPAPPL